MKRFIILFSLAAFVVSVVFFADHYLDLQGHWNRMIHLEGSWNQKTDSTEPGLQESNPYLSDISQWQKANDEVKGWLEVPGIGLSMPVVQHKDNEFYLTRDATKGNNKNGAAFIDYEVGNLNEADHIIIYGHNMENGQAFSNLMKYRNVSFAKEQEIFVLATPAAVRNYELLLVVDMDLSDEKSFFSFNSWTVWEKEKNAQQYIEEMRKRALYDRGQTVTPADQLLSLSTCDNSRENARCIVVAKEIPADEKNVPSEN